MGTIDFVRPYRCSLVIIVLPIVLLVHNSITFEETGYFILPSDLPMGV